MNIGSGTGLPKSTTDGVICSTRTARRLVTNGSYTKIPDESQGRWCYGKTPMQTFVDSIALAKEKILSPAVAVGGGTLSITQSR